MIEALAKIRRQNSNLRKFFLLIGNFYHSDFNLTRSKVSKEKSTKAVDVVVVVIGFDVNLFHSPKVSLIGLPMYGCQQY